ncbi:MAG: hypothetical protein HWE14_00925 [Flavobacteriia bacterium]|nr:hypothetical protein [Flavobacteriia bacterium]
MSPQTAAIIYTILSGIIILFQLSLALGAPWGAASMGGKYPGVYPPKMRRVAVINIFFLAFLALIVLAEADVAMSAFQSFSHIAIWVVAAFGLISSILNTITPSKIERIWAPVALIQLATSLVVALSN